MMTSLPQPTEPTVIKTDRIQPERLAPLTVLALGTTIVLWASAFAGIRVGLTGYSPTSLALFRFLIASLFLALYSAATGLPRPTGKDLLRFGVAGLIGIALYNVALNIGEQSISAGAASLLVNTAPIWTAMLSILFLRERFGWWAWAGVLVSFAGAAIIALGEGDGLQLNWYAGLVLLAALTQGVYNLVQKPLLAKYRPITCTTYAIWAGTLFLLPFAPGLLGEIQAAPTSATLAVVYLAIFPAALAYGTWSYALSRLPAGRAASYLYVIPVVALSIAWLWLGETPSVTSLLGGALAVAGVIIVSRRR